MTTLSRGDPRRPLLRIEASQPQTGLVLLLHGVGDSAYGMHGIATTWATALPHVRFVLPTAPFHAGRGTTWYVTDCQSGLSAHEEPLEELMQLVESDGTSKGVPLDRVVFMGFSQGSCLASWAALQLPEPCGGLVMLSGGCLHQMQITDAGRQTPILYLNGALDRTVICEHTRDCRDRLLADGCSLLHYIEMPDVGHCINAEMQRLTFEFLRNLLPPDLASAPVKPFHDIGITSVYNGNAVPTREDVRHKNEFEDRPTRGLRIPDGMTVILADGREGLVRGFDHDARQVLVELDDADGHVALALDSVVQRLRVELLTTAYACDEESPMTAEVVDVQLANGGEADTYLVQFTDGHRDAITPNKVRLLNGVVVRLATETAAERLRKLHGRYARVRAYVPSEGRYVLDVADWAGQVRLRPRQLLP